VRVSICDNAHGAVTYAWKADAGTLSASDANPVIWTAPASEGHYQVSVEVTNAAGSKSRGSAGVLVSRRPAAQLVVSVGMFETILRQHPCEGWSCLGVSVILRAHVRSQSA
jgi:hypothetical protein